MGPGAAIVSQLMSGSARKPGEARVVPPLVRFWKSDKGLSVFLVLLLILLFVLPPVAPPSSDHALLADLVFALLLLSGVLALSERRLGWWLLVASAVVSVAITLGRSVLAVSQTVVQVADLASLVLLLLVVLGHTFRAGPVNLHRIQGGIAAYLLLGAAWADSYALVEALRPGSFSGPVDVAGGRRGWVYFSFVTLTTVGYGDILPVHPAARSLAILEAVVGPLYIAILLARLVSLAVTPGTGTGTGRAPGSP
jgi:ion channel